MNTFTVIFCAPVANLEEWMQKPEAERKGDEQKMMSDWQAWTAAHQGNIVPNSGTALGTNMRVTKDGASVKKNDFMLYMMFQAESQEALVALLADHPHFGIPGGYIEVMPSRPM